MTSVVIFSIQEDNKNALAAMADTRYMAQDANGNCQRTSLDSGSKIFSIPLKVAHGYTFVRNEKTNYFIDSSFGLAFAGNTTIGLNTAGALSQICAFLECHRNNCDIGLNNIAEFTSKLLTDWHKQYNQWGPWTHVSEVAIFGYCPADATHKAFHLKPVRSSSGLWEIQSNQHVFIDPFDEALNGDLYNSECHPWLILGDHRDDIETLIKARVEDVIGVGKFTPRTKKNAQLSPQYVLEAIVLEETFQTIGNGLQILFADEQGARPSRWIRPQCIDTPDDEYEWYSFLNYSVDNLGTIGNAEIGNSGGFSPAYLPNSKHIVYSEFKAAQDRILKRLRIAYLQ